MHATVTRPYSHSVADTQSKYRPKAELDDEAWHDPIAILERAISEAQLLSPEELAQMREDARLLVADAAKAALEAPRPDPSTLREHLRAKPATPAREPEGETQVDLAAPVVALGEAVRLALHEAMAGDERVRVFGEDVADAPPELMDELVGQGGVFGTTFGLQRSFGNDRCYNTPLAEANIVGRAVGQAVRGLRPVPESSSSITSGRRCSR